MQVGVYIIWVTVCTDIDKHGYVSTIIQQSTLKRQVLYIILQFPVTSLDAF